MRRKTFRKVDTRMITVDPNMDMDTITGQTSMGIRMSTSRTPVSLAAVSPLKTRKRSRGWCSGSFDKRGGAAG